MPYPDMLARGVTNVATFTPFELWAGESDTVTSQGTVGATAIIQFQVIARDNNGKIVPWEPSVGSNVGTLYASQNVTFGGNPSANDTVTIGGNVITFVAANPADGQVLIGAGAADTAQNFVTFVSAHDTTLGVEAALTNATTVRLTAIVEGTDGNAITLSKSGTYPALGGSTLAGGTSTTTVADKPIGFAAQAGAVGGPIPFFTGGVPNHKALIWPASVTTLDQRKAAFDGTNITIGSLR